MKKYQSWFLYGLYTLAVAALFGYILFPSELVKSYLIAEIRKLNPNVNLTIEDVRPVFPPGLRLANVQLNYLGLPFMRADSATVVRPLKSLIAAGKGYRFKMKIHDGSIAGTASIGGRGADAAMDVQADVNHIAIGKLPFLSDLPGGKLEGTARAKLSYRGGGGQNRAIKADVQIDNFSIALSRPFFSITYVQVDTLLADVQLDDRRLKISSITFDGDQIAGSLSGSGVLQSSIQKSTVSLNGTVEPRPKLFESSGVSDPSALMRSLGAGGGGVPVTISGPLDNLEFSTGKK